MGCLHFWKIIIVSVLLKQKESIFG